jgi:hypothetical protein
LILALHFSNHAREAQAALQSFRARQEEAWINDRHWLELVENVLAGQPLGGVREQFHNLGFLRAAKFVEKLERRVAQQS